MLRFIFAILVFASFHHASAHPTVMGTISGENITLQTIGHAFAGSIKDRIIMGRKLPGQFVSEIKVIDHDRESVSYFKTNASSVFGGEIKVQSPSSSQSLAIEFVALDKPENKYTFKIGGKEAEIFVSADDFKNGHFINPEYTMTFEGETFQFKLEGQACYGYSMHLIAMIMGAAII
ncbi:MAG: hypothetical protein HRU09_04435 [Oligoflexales bacterium]|nr:hypothetical protein [Oligoflexales bacterium]